MDTALMIAVIALGVAVIALMLNLKQSLAGRKLARQLKTVEELMAVKDMVDEPLPPSFSARLNSAEKVQQQTEVKPVVQADKYRYVVALAEQGYAAVGIATALQMSPAEVEQVMQLARVKRPV